MATHSSILAWRIPVDRGAWQATVPRVAKSWAQLSDTAQHGAGGGLVAELGLTLGTPWTVACQAPLSLGFSRQEYSSGLSLTSPGDLLNPEMEPGSPALQADSLPIELQGK